MREHQTPTLGSVYADLDYLADAWPVLVHLKMPGTARSWVETPRRGVLRESDLERMGKKGVPRAAPADISVLSLLQSIVTTIDDLARTVVTVADLRKTEFLPVYSAAKDPIPWFRTTATWLNAAQEHDKQTVPWVASLLTPLAAQAEHLLGDVRAGQVMNGICPWCRGRERDSTLGHRTMQIRYQDPDLPSDQPLIVCRGYLCDPPPMACDRRWNNCPAWNQREWEWLADQLLTPGHPAEELSPWATPEQVANFLDVTIAKLSNDRQRGQGPRFKKEGHSVLYEWEAVHAYADARAGTKRNGRPSLPNEQLAQWAAQSLGV